MLRNLDAARNGRWLAWSVCCLLVVGWALPGCQPNAEPKAESPEARGYTPPPPPKTASEVLDRMVEAYHSAPSYADHGQFVLEYDLAGQHYQGAVEYAVALERPKKLRMQVGKALLACDGKRLRASVPWGEGELLDLPAPETVGLTEVMNDPAIKDLLYHTPDLPIAGLPIQLSLLWLEKPLEPLLQGAKPPVLLPPESVGNYRCYRVQVERDGQSFIYWIDKESFVLRRIELPSQTLAASLSQQGQGEAKNVSVTLDLIDAQFEPKIEPVAFQFEVPAGTQLVQQLVPREDGTAADGTGSSGPGSPPAVPIRRTSKPQELKLEKLWSSSEVKQPGEVLVVTEAGKPSRILVLNDWKAVAEFDSAGKLVATHPLELPNDEEKNLVRSLRTAVDSQGKRYYLGFASGKQQVHLFDADFKRLTSYPDYDAKAAPVADAELADINGDGTPEMILGYYDTVGVQAASLTGERLWSNRSMANVFSVAVTGPTEKKHREVLCTHERGTLVRIDSTGNNLPPIPVLNLFIRYIKTAELGNDVQRKLLALSFVQVGQDMPIGLSLGGKLLWSAAPMLFRPATEVIASGSLTGPDGQWILAGADGSIHFIDADGTQLDRFYYGSAIQGMGVAQLDSPALIVATAGPEGSVEAWRVEAPKP